MSAARLVGWIGLGLIVGVLFLGGFTYVAIRQFGWREAIAILSASLGSVAALIVLAMAAGGMFG